MKIFLSALESNPNFLSPDCWLNRLDEMPFRLKWNLCSFFYLLRGKQCRERAKIILNNSELVLIDSGAHSFQKGARVDWKQYTEQYAEFIKQNNPQIF